MEAVRFPDDYDGIIAGAPAFRFQEFASWMLGVHRAQGPNPLTRESLKLLDDASRTACDALDGVEDGVIGDPRRCTGQVFDLSALACKRGQSESCLTDGQIQTARAVYEDVVDGEGNLLSPGVSPGAEAAGDWAFWMLPNPLVGSESIIGGMGEILSLLKRYEPDFDVEQFDPVADRGQLDDVTSPLDIRTADLTEFRDRGGKLLMYQGWNDYPLRPQRALDYLAEAEKATGGARRTAEFFRLFMVPGMTHCSGGPGAWQADYVDLLIAWREEGDAPDRIVASHPGPTPMFHLLPDERVEQPRRFTRPLCPHPSYAEYSGRGDVDDERSFRCAGP